MPKEPQPITVVYLKRGVTVSRVYRYEEAMIRPQPCPQDFTRELAYTQATLDDMYREGTISGAFIFGPISTDPSPLSDIDLMIGVPVLDLPVAAKIRNMTQETYKRSGIPVDAVCYSDQDLASGEHGYFREHMLLWFNMLAAKKPENIIGRNPLDITKPVQRELLMDIDGKFGEYDRELLVTYMNGWYWQPELTLEKILNLPSRAGRQALGALLVRDLVPRNALMSSQKSIVDVAVEEILGAVDPTIMEPYQRINASTLKYAELLKITSGGNVTQRNYEATVHQLLEAGLPDAIVLAGKMRQAYRVLAQLS